MTPEAQSFVRAAVLFGLALAVMPLLKRRSAVARRIVLSVAFAAVLAVPFAPSLHVDAPALPAYGALLGRVVAEPVLGAVASSPAVRIAHGSVSASSVGSIGPLTWLSIAWGLGAILVAARVVVGLVLSKRIADRASRTPLVWSATIARAARITGLTADVRVSSEVEGPAVAGLLHPVVLVPTSSSWWTDDRRLAVLLHELAHVAAHDLAVQTLASAACALHWFNPLAWVAARRLRLERELAADEAVLRGGVRATTYALDLLAIAGSAPFGTVAIGEKPLTSRISAIVAERRPAALGATSAITLGFGATAVALGVACTTTAEAPGSSAPSTTAVPTTSPTESARSTDADLQAFAESEAARAVSDWKAEGASVLVMTPKGELLADAGGRSDRPYVAGSTMKPFLLAAAIDEGVVNESDVFDCSNGERGGKVLHDQLGDDGPPTHVTLAELLARSSNVGFAQIFDRLGGARTSVALQRFHFATPASLANAKAGDWDGALTAIGSTMSTTPRQVTRAYATLADGGDGVVSPRTAARVSAMLEGVVTSSVGTGNKARVAGVRVAGKTGTSDWTTPAGATGTYASFVGYVPADHPRFVIFVGVDTPHAEGAWGGAAAAPVFARVAEHALAR